MPAAPLLELARDPFPGRALRRPPVRAGVHRPRLLAPLLDPDAPPLTVLVAPAGFGKTALLAEWSARDPRPFAWLTLGAGHDDSRQLLRSVTLAIDSAAAQASDGRVVLVLDNVQVLRSAAAHEIVAAIATYPPDTVAVALASRAQVPAPVARLRAEGLVTELSHDDLAMTRAEAASLFRAAGLRLERDEIDA